ncbi:MAG TPA: hypothetical protein VII68_16805 [Casimicrobiaceae bacterium]|jgi:hypothetical protein
MAPRVDLPGPLGVIDIPPRWIKPCSVNHWGEGVLIASTPSIDPDGWYRFSEIPNGIVSDGDGGAFVLSTAIEGWGLFTGGLSSVRHVSATGVAGPNVLLTLPAWWPGVVGYWSEAAIVASRKHHAIVADFSYTSDLNAQRYDRSGTPLWRPRRGIQLSSSFAVNTTGNVINLAGEEDAKGGAIFAWREYDAAGDSEIHAQRVSRDGVLRWGASAPRVGPVAGARWLPPQPWHQLVATGKGGAIVVAPEASGATFRYVARSIGPTGAVTAPTTLVTAGGDGWVAYQRLRLAVPDGAGGLFLAYPDAAGAIRLLRYTPGMGVRWDIATGMAIEPNRLAIREDDRDGVLVAGVGGTPSALRLRRYDANGAVTFDIDAVAPPLVVEVVWGGTYQRDYESRSVIPMPDGAGGAIVMVHEMVTPTGPLAVVTRCFNAQGRLVSPAVPLTSHFWGQIFPRATVGGLRRVVVAYTQYENVDISHYDVSAQRVGCCEVPGDRPPPPPFGCEIVELPPFQPGRFDFRLPCGNLERGFGVIPLSRFVTRVPRAPGGLATHDAPVPAWVRLVFRNLSDDIAISLCTLAGKRVATAKPVKALPGVLELTFAPPKEADLLVVVSCEGGPSRETKFSFDVSIAFGEGQPPALVRRAFPRKGRTARR